MSEQLYEYEVPCHFGLESVLKKEITDLGYAITSVLDGRVRFEGPIEAVCRANIFLRTAERVMVCIGRFTAVTFDELFEGTRALPWEMWIPKDGRFWVTKASTKNSKLFSASDIQSIVKKAIVERLKARYRISWFPENGSPYPLRVFIHKDEVSICLETTGDSLHKRGYRRLVATAPVSETLAAALLMLTPWKADRILVDPFCGSGTFPIEAAMMAARIPPGLNRGFTAEDWTNVLPKKAWYDAVSEGNDQIIEPEHTDIQGYDLDGDVIKVARANAREAGVDHLIHFQQRPVSELRHPKKYGFIITNPPYGERLEDKASLPALYTEIKEAYARLDAWSMYILTAYADAQTWLGRKADKNRKIYNGMMQAYFYQYMGPKPPARRPG